MLGVLAGLVVLWPSGDASPRPQGPGAGAVQRARVLSVTPGGCERFAGPGCRIAALELDGGERTTLALARDRFAPPVEAGDRIRVARNTLGGTGEEVPLDDASQQPVAFVDFDTTVLAVVAVRGADVTGLASEEARLLLAGIEGDISLQGLVVAGMVIGALGVLDDLTVSQASMVLALRRANPALGFRRLLGEALAVGRDHLGATINTLVLAYAGAALPVLLLFNTEGTPFGDAVNREPVAEQVVAMLVGSIGLIAALPLTTAIAALLASRLPAAAVPDERHSH